MSLRCWTCDARWPSASGFRLCRSRPLHMIRSPTSNPYLDAGPPGTDLRGGPSGSPRDALAGGARGGAPREVPRRACRAYGVRAADGQAEP
eukprot:7862315-Alexandrium_andersonii.AAC.1